MNISEISEVTTRTWRVWKKILGGGCPPPSWLGLLDTSFYQYFVELIKHTLFVAF